jgi:hypothetical protein
VEQALDGGDRPLETMGEYRNKYVFAAANSGNNLNALRQWAAEFSVEQDFSRLVAGRIENRMSASTSFYPDDEYGSFFETLMKKAYLGSFTGAVREDEFWIHRRFFERDGLTAIRESYDYVILISIEKPLLETQITKTFSEIRIPRAQPREQTAAVNRVKENFFEGF